ncbi:magnesium/cobalt transporter CorA [Paenibacillus harenae]|uniref:magnesium/cobalt transporter CorA n=1 Tax=Paenibacillus harenae TaxID=306543 RepID=UPI0003FF7877|nr:magnesium/cobalt transporter CorA [Paenibacillus harenae]
MIHTLAITEDFQIKQNVSLGELHNPDIDWYWVDFDCPTDEEIAYLDHFFHFHPLAIEDCLHLLQRPKLDHYDNINFFVLHALNSRSLEAEEVDIFLGDKFLVTFHLKPQDEIDAVRTHLLSHKDSLNKGPVYVHYKILDKITDQYFPSVFQIEDTLHNLENNTEDVSSNLLMDELFDIRSDLLKIRKTIVPMRDLLYRIIGTDKIIDNKQMLAYYKDIYDHLLKLSDMVEANREMTSDIRDSYISINSYRMNNIMKTLTVITTIFMPLTFIAGLYGMNFDRMPELHWPFGYYLVLILMVTIGVSMYMWFKIKGWFK